MIPALLVVLAIVDAAFAGFRAAAGRDGHIDKLAYYRRAVLLGAGAGAGLAAVLAALTGAVLVASGEPAAVYEALLVIGARMLPVLLGYAALVLASLALYATARLELRILATVAILGPFTLLRPLVVLAATARGVAASSHHAATALTVVASAAVLLVGWWLDRRYA